MKNIDFLVQILASDYSYWVVARKNICNYYGRDKRGDDEILIISIPQGINRYSSKEQIMFTDLEKLYRAELDNIFITGNYPPFQWYVTMRDIYFGYPIKSNVKQFMVDALNLKSNNIFEYKELLEKYENEAKEVVNQ